MGGEAVLARWIGSGTGLHNRRKTDNRNTMLFHHEQREAVLQDDFFVWWQLKGLRGSPRCRRQKPGK